jgi:uncharacterized repeat protein (TIGR03847 family)
MSESYEFDSPRLFTVGIVGEPGHRMFFLQAHADGVTVSVKCEKQQAAALADYLANVLASLPAVDPAEPGPLIESLVPLDIAWVAGLMAVAYDEDIDRVVLVIEELAADEAETADTPGASLRLRLTRAQVAAYIHHARRLVAAGRPPCRLCEQPIDPEGHVCPRLN